MSAAETPSRTTAVVLAAVAPGLGEPAQDADYPVKDTDKYAYAENAGWVNFKPTSQGATLHANGASSFLTGYVWAENVGYIKLAYDNNAAAPFTNTTNKQLGRERRRRGQSLWLCLEQDRGLDQV